MLALACLFPQMSCFLFSTPTLVLTKHIYACLVLCFPWYNRADTVVQLLRSHDTSITINTKSIKFEHARATSLVRSYAAVTRVTTRRAGLIFHFALPAEFMLLNYCALLAVLYLTPTATFDAGKPSTSLSCVSASQNTGKCEFIEHQHVAINHKDDSWRFSAEYCQCKSFRNNFLNNGFNPCQQ